jgi:hypothetical protein
VVTDRHVLLYHVVSVSVKVDLDHLQGSVVRWPG